MMVTAGNVDVLSELGCGTQFQEPFNNEDDLMVSYVEGVKLLGKSSGTGSTNGICAKFVVPLPSLF